MSVAASTVVHSTTDKIPGTADVLSCLDLCLKILSNWKMTSGTQAVGKKDSNHLSQCPTKLTFFSMFLSRVPATRMCTLKTMARGGTLLSHQSSDTYFSDTVTSLKSWPRLPFVFVLPAKMANRNGNILRPEELSHTHLIFVKMKSIDLRNGCIVCCGEAEVNFYVSNKKRTLEKSFLSAQKELFCNNNDDRKGIAVWTLSNIDIMHDWSWPWSTDTKLSLLNHTTNLLLLRERNPCRECLQTWPTRGVAQSGECVTLTRRAGIRMPAELTNSLHLVCWTICPEVNDTRCLVLPHIASRRRLGQGTKKSLQTWCATKPQYEKNMIAMKTKGLT